MRWRSDVVLASDQAYFVQAFTRIGLIPDAGGTFALPRRLEPARAMGAALFADKITAQQAADWGMIYECIPQADLRSGGKIAQHSWRTDQPPPTVS